MIALIAAMDPASCIGNKGVMPWHCPSELAVFRKLTMGHKVIMGRVTWDGIAKVLPGRDIILCTRQKAIYATAMVQIESDAQHFLKQAAMDAEYYFVAGGRQLYEQALPYAQELFLSILKKSYAGDTYFPAFDPSLYEVVLLQEQEEFTQYHFKRKKDTTCGL